MSNHSTPLVTVGIALYNHEKFIVQCLESVVKQTYKNMQIIVIDDGSTDNSYKVAKDFLELQNYNKNFSIISRPNKGMCHTLNEIAKQAQGKYISFVGSDDYWMKEKIEQQVSFLEEYPDLALVHSNSIKVDDKDKQIGFLDYSTKENNGSLYKALIYGTGGINTPSHLYKTVVYDTIGYYDPDLKFEDTDFWLRLTRVYKVGYMNTFHTFYRWHGENLSDSKNILEFYNNELIKIFKKNITDGQLKQYAVAKMYRKSFLRALRTFRIQHFFSNFAKYIKCKLFNLC